MSESSTLLSMVKNLRRLLREGVGEGDIVDAINGREYIYIYYAGDDTIERGYRTVRPFVLGTSTAGNKVLRAWQDMGKSDSLRADSPRKRRDHEYFTDDDGKEKPGWRLFLVDKITSVYPTGKRFVDGDGKVMVPPLYNERDKQMTSIVASVPVTPPETTKTKGLDSVSEPDVVKQKVDKSTFDAQAPRFRQFYNVGQRRREATARDVEKLYDIVRRVKKKSPDAYIVAVNNKGDFHLVDAKNRDKIPQDAQVGTLSSLYSRLVRGAKDTSSTEKSFIERSRASLRKK